MSLIWEGVLMMPGFQYQFFRNQNVAFYLSDLFILLITGRAFMDEGVGKDKKRVPTTEGVSVVVELCHRCRLELAPEWTPDKMIDVLRDAEGFLWEEELPKAA